LDGQKNKYTDKWTDGQRTTQTNGQTNTQIMDKQPHIQMDRQATN